MGQTAEQPKTSRDPYANCQGQKARLHDDCGQFLFFWRRSKRCYQCNNTHDNEHR